MAKPTDLPEWASSPQDANDIVVPSAGRKLTGWHRNAGVPEKPPYQFFNWFQNLVYRWISYFNENIDQGVKVGDSPSFSSLTVTNVTGPSINGRTLILKDPSNNNGSFGAKNTAAILSGFEVRPDGTVRALNTGVGLTQISALLPANETDEIATFSCDAVSNQTDGAVVAVTHFGVKHHFYANGSAKFDGLLESNSFIYNVNTSTLGATHAKNLAHTGTDKNIIICLGNSHSWGQGSPSYEGFYANEMNGHSAYSESLGYFRRIKEFIESKKDWETRTFRPAKTETGGGVTQRCENIRNKPVSLNGAYLGAYLISGQYDIQAGSTITPSAYTAGWFNPVAIGDTYSPFVYRDRVFRNHFGSDLFLFGPSTLLRPNMELMEKEGYICVVPDETVTPPGSGYTHYSSNGGYYGDWATDGTNSVIYTRDATLPYWAIVDAGIFIAGYGLLKIRALTATPSGGWAIFLKTTGGSNSLVKNPFPCIYPGSKIYKGSLFADAKINIPLDKAIRSTILAVQIGPLRGKIGLCFMDEGSNQSDGVLNTLTRASVFHSNSSAGVKVFQVVNGVDSDISAGGNVTITANKVIFDCYYASDMDIIVKIDWGMRQKGSFWLSYEGANASATNYSGFGAPCIALRGLKFDANYVENWAMGAHSTGDLLGLTESYYNETRDHIGDIINYCPYTPSLLIFEAPLVNEYLRQTSINTFSTNIASIITRFNGAKNAEVNRRLDTVIFSTLGGMDVDYENAISSAISYDLYSSELKRLSDLNGFVYVDFRAMFKEMVRLGMIEDYHLLYDDNNHPSPFVNEFIAKYMQKVLDFI